MKTIENITVKVTYRVMLGNVEVSDEVYQDLINCESMELSNDNISISYAQANAMEWLSDNISEHDACDFEFEIEDIE